MRRSRVTVFPGRMRNLTRSFQIFLWSYVFVFVVACSLRITQVDVWWQLSEGLRILQAWAPPTGPAVAFGLPATPYFDEYAGYEAVLALLFKIGGFPGLWMFFSAVYLAIIFLPVATSGRKYPAFDFSSTAALLVAGTVMMERQEQRPELVAGLLLVLLMATLRKSRLEKVTARTPAVLFFLFLVWTNTHSTFVIGLGMLGLWLGCELLLKYREFPLGLLLRGAFFSGGAALIATVLNPYGPRRLLFPFLQAVDPGSTALSPEMWPITELGSTEGVLILLTAAFLAWGLLTTKGVPLWLILFSFFSVFISFKGFRFINFPAISLLFVYAARTEAVPADKSPPPLALSLLRDTALCLLCIFLIFYDALSLLSTWNELRGERRLATHTPRFAPEICAIRVNDSDARVPVLCAYNVGSYLSFEGNGRFRPLLDSGLSHFSSETKRYFFFLSQEPAALVLALRDLHVNNVIINKDTFPWIPTLHRLPEWEFVTCDATGMLFQRSPAVPSPLSASNRDQIEKSVHELRQNGDIVGAFDYSTLLDDPAKSLSILAQYNGPEWTDPFFNSLCAWVDSLPTSAVEEFLASEHPRRYPLVDAVLSARLGPDSLAKFIATNPPGPRPWFWKALQVENCLRNGDRNRARAIFNTISPAPISSAAYYELWQEARGQTSDSGLSAYGQWQTWNGDARLFLESMSARLNDRLTELDRRPSP